MSNDGTTSDGGLYRNKLKHPHMYKEAGIVDHNVPILIIRRPALLRKKCVIFEDQIDFWEKVCHQVMMENYVDPGELIFGADSHTCSYGRLGTFGTGVGCTDFLYGMVTGTSGAVPETVKFNLIGRLPEGVYARDLILTIIGEIEANGTITQVMEFTEGERL